MSAIARWCFDRRHAVVLLWAVLLVGLAAGALAAGSHFAGVASASNTESGRAAALLQQADPGAAGSSGTIVWHAAPGTVRSPAVEAQLSRALAQVAHAPGVTAVTSPYTNAGASQISPDGHTAYATVSYSGVAAGDAVPKDDVTAVQRIVDGVHAGGLDLKLGGQAFTPTPGASGTEAIGVIAALVILLLMFRSLWAAVLPVLTGIAGVGTASLGVILLSHLVSLPSTTPTMGALIGLGVGIDYALFIVNRHRKELMAGQGTRDAAARSLATSGRAVAFAGLTVIVALLGMRLLGMSILSGMVLGAAVTVAMTVLAAVTLLPAVLGMLGPRVLSRRQRRRLASPRALSLASSREPGGWWGRWSQVVAARPTVLGVVALGLMALLAIPGLTIRLGTADAGNNAHTTSSYQAYEMLADGFGPGFNGPLVLAARAPAAADAARLTGLVRELATVPGVAAVHAAPAAAGTDITEVTVIPTTSPESSQTSDLISSLRHDVIPRAEAGSGLKVYVGGLTASNDDTASALFAKIPLFLGVVIALGFVLLAAAFRSLVIPAVGAVMNVLTMGAAFGAIVLVFQHGLGAALLHAGSAGPIEPIVPALITGIIFGLSMDYQVFLVSQMQEEWLRTGDSRRSVRTGHARTGQVIAVAAAIMFAVFAAFTVGGQRVIAELGLGLAVAVAMDAFLLRLIAVPALMHLAGRSSWWLPRWLDRALPRLTVEGGTVEGGTVEGGTVEGGEAGTGTTGQREPDPAQR
jgi:RND superfamily putative drug exporter